MNNIKADWLNERSRDLGALRPARGGEDAAIDQATVASATAKSVTVRKTVHAVRAISDADKRNNPKLLVKQPICASCGGLAPTIGRA